MTRSALLGASLLGAGILLPRHALGEADTSRLVMRCDHPGCRDQVHRAPRIVVPSRTPLEYGHKPIKVMTELHYCQPHATPLALDVQRWLTPGEKRNIEQLARTHRPAEFKPDFEAARLEWVLVTTPEYRLFLKRLGVKRVFTA